MAAIVKRGNKYSVVFNYTDENGVTRQKWESPVSTKKEAQKRKNEIEHELATVTFIAPSAKKVRDFLVEFVEMYGLRKWGLSMYTSNTGLIRNYINPILGDVNMQDVDAHVVDKFISTLQKTKAVECNSRKPKTEFVTPCTIEKIVKLLRGWKESQEKAKAYLGDSYYDYNLVLTLDNGRPCEDRVIGNAFNRLKKNADLPDVIFHSLRHSSTTYKLKLNKGDVKATQGDTGHAQPDMVTEVYAHILDEDRKVNAQRFEAGFYARADLRGVEQSFRTQSVQQPGMDIV